MQSPHITSSGDDLDSEVWYGTKQIVVMLLLALVACIVCCHFLNPKPEERKSIRLTWDEPDNRFVTGYRVHYRRLDHDEFFPVITVEGHANTFVTISNLIPEVDYAVSVSSMGILGSESVRSAEILVVIPKSPTTPKIKSIR